MQTMEEKKAFSRLRSVWHFGQLSVGERSRDSRFKFNRAKCTCKRPYIEGMFFLFLPWTIEDKPRENRVIITRRILMGFNVVIALQRTNQQLLNVSSSDHVYYRWSRSPDSRPIVDTSTDSRPIVGRYIGRPSADISVDM